MGEANAPPDVRAHMDVYITMLVIPTSIYEHVYSAHVYVGMSTYIYIYIDICIYIEGGMLACLCT